MNRESENESRKILEDIIRSFSPNKFVRFFREKNRDFKPREESLSREYDDESFKNGLKLGEIEFPDGRVIICAFEAQKPLSERSGRKDQYKKGIEILKGTQTDAGIFIFYDPSGNFRFSLIYQEVVGNNRTWSKFRRFTYFVSSESTNKTFKWQMNDCDFSSIEEIRNAFSIEKVTNEFYQEYRKLFEMLVSNLSANHAFLNQAKKHDLNIENFAKKLLGQVVFIYFIQKKGWMGVPAGQDWGNGDKNFLANLFKSTNKEVNFFNDCLELLFYGTLNNPRRNSADPSFSKDFGCRIPFLNGGLFEAEYDWKNSFIYLDNEIFKNIFEIFDRFNFTIEEESPDDKEIAVDPEMLGKVFENLLPENLRKGHGTYYTPREIVYYMCQESLIDYLSTSSQINKNKIKKYLENDSIDLLSEEEGLEIDGLLQEIKVCDPACGSGAFLVGMLNEIVRLRLRLRLSFPSGLSKEAEYKLKKNAIHNCIYGVDVDPGAIEIAKLRLWLALVVDYEIGDIEPLPNLDYRLMCGNSLLEEFEGVRFYNGEKDTQADFFVDARKRNKVTELKRKLEEYFDIHDDEEKKEKRKEINNIKDWLIRSSLEKRKRELEAQKKREQEKGNMFNNKKSREKYFAGWSDKFLAESKINEVLENLHNPKKAKPFFIWKLEFLDVFEGKAGFDIVVANPPYVRADSGPDYLAFRKQLEESKQYRTLYEKWDLMIPFIEKGLKISNSNGNLIYIVSNAVCTSKYAFKLLDLVQEEYFTRSINYFEEMKVFEAGVIPVVLHIGKKETKEDVQKIIRSHYFENIVREATIKTSEFRALKRNAFRKEYNPIESKVEAVALGAICYLSVGMVINANEKIAKGEFVKDDLISSTKTDIHSRTYVEGKDIDSYVIEQLRYLEWGTKRVPGQLRRPTFPELYDRPKLMRGRVTGGIYDESGLICNDSIVLFVRYTDLKGINNKSIQKTIKKASDYTRPQLETISERFDLKYLLAILNSSFALTYLNNIRRHRLENYFYPDDFRKLPIAGISLKEQKPFIALVNKILSITRSNDYLNDAPKQKEVEEYKTQIDLMIYELYGLTKEDIAIIDGSGKD